MSGRPETWPARRPEARRIGPAAAVGIALFLLSFALLHVAPLDERQIVDTPVYQQYGDAILDGRVPYRDFSLEYPPGALPVFVLPSLVPADDYRSAFEAVVLVCGIATVVLVAVALGSAGASRGRLIVGVAVAGLAPLALGSVVLTRFDLWPAALTAGALAAVVSDRFRLGGALLGIGAAAKLYPAVLLPLLLVHAASRRGTRGAAAALAAFVVALGMIVVPFAILSPDGLVASFERQLGRPLQVESVGSVLLLGLHQVGLYEPTVVSSHGSQNLVGSGPEALAALLTAAQILAVVGLWLLAARSRGSSTGLLAAAAGVVAAFIALGKVLSPQFLIWLVPLVPLVAGPLGVVAAGLFLAALVTTQLYFPKQYWELVGLEAVPTWLLAARDFLLLVLVAVLATATARAAEAPRRP